MRIKGQGLNRVKLITHADLDGVSSAVIGTVVFGDSLDVNMEVTSTAVNTIERFILNDLDISYRALYITDLSLPESLVELISKICKQKQIAFHLFDHHHSTVHLNQREDCTVIENDVTCGASLFYDYLKQIFKNNVKLKDYRRFIEEVTAYDTGHATEKSLELNMLLRVIGKKRFIDRFSSEPSLRLSTDEKAVLILEKERIERYVYSHKLMSFSAKMKINNSECDIIIGFAGDCFMEIFDELFKMYPNINTAVLINFPYGMSWRLRQGYSQVKQNEAETCKTTIGNFTFTDVLSSSANLACNAESSHSVPVQITNLALIAEQFGGGGHKESAGNKISENFVKDVLVKLFSENNFKLNFN